MRRNLFLSAVSAVLLACPTVVQPATVMAPRFEVDPMWPKPLPNHWVMGATVGVSVDAQSHIWIIHRPNALEDNEVHAAKSRPGRYAAHRPRRFSNSIRPATWWATGVARPWLRLAGAEPRNHCRFQG